MSDLDNLKTPTYDRHSRMYNYDLIYDPVIENVRAGYYKRKFKNYTLNGTEKYFTVTSQYQYRTDLISRKFYETSKYDWIIEEVNNIEDPIKDVVIGKKLIIPDITRVL